MKNHGYHKNLERPYDNNEDIENHENPLENCENHEHFENHCGINKIIKVI